MRAVLIGKTQLQECPQCEGLWADKDSLEEICANAEQQSAVLGAPGVSPPSYDVTLEKVRYSPCPLCGKLMNRVNFAQCSHVVVDVCNLHGTWFDKDELRRIVEFIRAGGLDKAREMKIRQLEWERLKRDESQGSLSLPRRDPIYDDYAHGMSAVFESIFDMLGRDPRKRGPGK
jgi:Zn-finger nucleic acid-binding protein